MTDSDRIPGRDMPEPLATSLRGWLRDGVQLLRVRLELLGVEAQEHALDAIGLLVGGVAAAMLLGAGLVFLSVLLTVLLWDSQRVLVLAVLATLFLTLGAVALWWTRVQWRAMVGWFSASVGELRQDEERLKP